MKPKTMILIVLAVTCGLGASWMTRQVLMGRQTEEKETVEILVAKRHLSVGERLSKPEELFERKTILKEHDTPDAIRDIELLKGKILKQGRNRGDAVVAANMFSENEQIAIPSGYRALGLKVNLETSASGLASLPHSRVDLIWFQKGPSNETSRVDVLLQNVLVLAADGKIDRDGVTAVAQVVTLALTPEEVLKVNLAKETGILNLSLRNLGEQTLSFTPGFTGEQMRSKGHNADRTPAVVEEPPIIIAKLTPSMPKAENKPMPEAVKPEIDEPKTIQHTLTIVNGSETGNRVVTKVGYQTTLEGQVIDQQPQPESRPEVTPPATRPQRQPQPAAKDY